MQIVIDTNKWAENLRANNQPYMAAALEQGEGLAQQFCGWLAQQQGNQVAQGGNQVAFARELPAGKDHHQCGGACGGKCGGACGGACGFKPGGGQQQQQQQPGMVPVVPGAAPLQVLPQCYLDCDCIDACLYEFLKHARLDFDEWSWLELNKNESDIVHLNVPAGGVGYQAALPLAASQKIIFQQELGQQLPYQPGAIKIDPKWTGNAVPDQVTVTLYAGDRGLTGITNPAASGLIIVGRPFTLQDFECKDDCYVVPWPRLFGCRTSAIPHRRAIYIEFAASSALGQATVTSLNPTILKKGSRLYGKYCGNGKA
ncbi:hypothetical protein OV203_44870 [Nannocystis sp. ILAH1]|uniref:hypothetical protein n=1 Tax=Nannocystis sp. ILAH1 TaxID=2996789 RepID=UPI002271C2A4|nr:hypothetical protein [Nannocystis sp. ILAH1]MCY0994342.1 hypothetical protein [Nannocystis sp. ILAH1]